MEVLRGCPCKKRTAASTATRPASGAPSTRSKRCAIAPSGDNNVTHGNTSFSLPTSRNASCPAVSWITPDGAKLRSSVPSTSIRRATGRSAGRHRAVVGGVDRQRDRRESVLELDRDRNSLGRLGRFLRSRRAAEAAQLAGRPGFPRADADRFALRQAARGSYRLSSSAASCALSKIRGISVRWARTTRTRRASATPSTSGCRRASFTKIASKYSREYFLHQQPSGIPPDYRIEWNAHEASQRYISGQPLRPRALRWVPAAAARRRCPARCCRSRIDRGSGARRFSTSCIIVQENRSFDNLFATFPGANGATRGKSKSEEGHSTSTSG